MKLTKEHWAIIFMGGCALALLLLGLHMQTLPAITLFRVWPYYLLPSPETILALSLCLIVFSKYAAKGLLWVLGKLHRLLSSLVLIFALGADGLLHLFSIPHFEGWWISLIGSSALLTFIHAQIQKYRSGRHS